LTEGILPPAHLFIRQEGIAPLANESVVPFLGFPNRTGERLKPSILAKKT